MIRLLKCTYSLRSGVKIVDAGGTGMIEHCAGCKKRFGSFRVAPVLKISSGAHLFKEILGVNN